MNATPQFLRSEDGVAWKSIGFLELQRKLRGTYKDVNKAIKALRDGQEIRTATAVYKFDRPPQDD